MQYKKIFVLFLCVSFAQFSAVYAQNVAKLLQKADEEYSTMSYVKAIESYEQAFTKGKNFDADVYNKAQLNLANAYFLVKDFGKAERNYREVLERNIRLKGEDIKAYLRFAQVLASGGKHAESKVMYQKYSELQEQDKRSAEFIKLYSNLEALTRNASSYKIEYLGINTSSADFSPTYYQNGLVFVSGRSQNTSIKRIFKWDNSSFLDLFFLDDLKKVIGQNSSSAISSSSTTTTTPNQSSRPLGNDYYTPATSNDASTIATQGSELITGSTDYVEYATVESKKFSKTINSKYHEGPCAFFHKEKKIIFTRNSQNVSGLLGAKKESVSRLKLYISDYKTNDWGNIKELPFNSDTYSCGHPTLTVDDKMLYFVSDMPGGYGGTDIYMVQFKNGEWSKPQNLGGTINTQGNEMFPFVDDRGNLYFASDGHPGLGGLDMFFVSMNTATGLPVSRARNLGAPLNSSQDDFGIITDSERESGFLSSNRKRGGSDDDIYRFERLGPLYGCRELVVNVFDNTTKKPLAQSRFDYFSKLDTTHVESAITSSLGTIKLCLEADQEFVFTFGHEGYRELKKTITNKEDSDYEPTKLDIYLRPVVVEEKKTIVKSKEMPRTLVQKRDHEAASKIFKGTITAGNGDPIAGVRLRFTNLCTGIVQEMLTLKDGTYTFERDVNCDYELVASKDDFALSKEIIYKLVEKKILFARKKEKPKIPNFNGSISSFFDTKLYKVGDVVKLENIYYESNSSVLTKNATRELDRLVLTLKRYPSMIVEIRSHTDTRGNASENQALSQRRANEVVRYLTKKGIDERRLRGIGKGESLPVNKCSDGVQCTETEHQRNRRTEFRILQIEKIG